MCDNFNILVKFEATRKTRVRVVMMQTPPMKSRNKTTKRQNSGCMDAFLGKATKRSEQIKKSFTKPNIAGRSLSNLSTISSISGFDDDIVEIETGSVPAKTSIRQRDEKDKGFDSDDGFEVTSILKRDKATSFSASLSGNTSTTSASTTTLTSTTKTGQNGTEKRTVRAWETRMTASQEATKRSLLGERKRNLATALSSDSLAHLQMAKKQRLLEADKFKLTDEQQRVMTLVQQGKSVFFTGAAGTGKSRLLRALVAMMQDAKGNKLAITASTGLAAITIGGTTLHKWIGLGLALENVDALYNKVMKNRSKQAVWLNTDTLVIDEISMIDGDFFDKLEQLARKVRKNNLPFGGIQLILTGDFFQLPPVSKNGALAKMCFQAQCWSSVFSDSSQTILLTRVFRQEGDSSLIEMLSALRQNNMSPDIVAKFRKLDRTVKYDDGVDPTSLFSTRAEVAHANNIKLAQLAGPVRVFDAEDSKDGPGSFSLSEEDTKALDNLMAQRTVSLKIGASVIVIQNIRETLVNGMRGRVLTFAPDSSVVTKLLELRRIYPQILDCYNESLGHLPSTVNSWVEFVQKYGYECIEAMKEISTKFYMRLSSKQVHVSLNSTRHLPVVEFVYEGIKHVELIEKYKFETTYGVAPNKVKLYRNQIPLITAWALSIHKAQGQTLDRVVVDLNRAFERGQVYVAISRATSTESLQILGFDPKRVRVDDRVVEFYKRLSKS